MISYLQFQFSIAKISQERQHLEFTHFSPSRGSKAAQAGNSTPMVGKERSTTVPLCFAILQPLSCRPSVALFSSGGSFLQTSSVVEYLREGPFVECVVLELRTTEVEQEPIRRSRRAHIVDNLRPFNTRQILDGLQLNNVQAFLSSFRFMLVFYHKRRSGGNFLQLRHHWKFHAKRS